METAPGALTVRLTALERELDTLRATLANSEKAFYISLDQTAPDVTEEILEDGQLRTISYASVLLSDLAPAVHEILEIHYRNGTVWHVLPENKWELRDGTLLVRMRYIAGDQLLCKIVCR